MQDNIAVDTARLDQCICYTQTAEESEDRHLENERNPTSFPPPLIWRMTNMMYAKPFQNFERVPTDGFTVSLQRYHPPPNQRCE